MPRDPIVDEVRAIRDAYARRFAYDLDAIVADVQRRERESGVKTVTLPPRPVVPVPPPADRAKP
ncbi:MAG: hypothetical protein WAT39_17940 [Planctomycetota bacterium]